VFPCIFVGCYELCCFRLWILIEWIRVSANVNRIIHCERVRNWDSPTHTVEVPGRHEELTCCVFSYPCCLLQTVFSPKCLWKQFVFQQSWLDSITLNDRNLIPIARSYGVNRTMLLESDAHGMESNSKERGRKHLISTTLRSTRCQSRVHTELALRFRSVHCSVPFSSKQSSFIIAGLLFLETSRHDSESDLHVVC